MAKLYIIDGNSLLFRAYYATAYGNNPIIMRTKDGIPTNALFAFANMINTILSSFKGDESIIVGFDTDKKTFRHEEDKNYKANRKPCPEDLLIQMPIARQLLKALGIYHYEQVGVEGDDICGTVAKLASDNNYEIQIYTSDRDFLQLINDKINVMILVKGMKDIRKMDQTTMMSEYGFTPLQIIDYKGLRGDSSDNLPGIPGVGEVTAKKLIEKYQTFENIMNHAEEIGGKVGNSLIENRAQGELCKKLATIKIDVNLPFTLDDLKYNGYDFDTLNNFCQQYELKQLLNRVPSSLKKGRSKIDDNIEYETITSFKNINIPSEISFSLDRDDNNYNNTEIYGLSFNFSNKNYYISFNDFLKDEIILDILKDKNIKKNCYDYKAIKVALNHHLIEVNGLDFDILLASYILDSGLNNNVDSVMHYFGIDLYKEDKQIDLFTVNSGSPKRICQLSEKINQCKEAAISSLKVVDSYLLYKNIEIPLCEVLANMEIEGFPLDKKVLEEIGFEYRDKINLISEDVYVLAGEKFNISSPKQVGEILFDKLGLAKGKGNSTSIETLNAIKNDHPIIDKILEYRKYAKLVSTYVDGLKSHILADGKIHAMFNQAQTSTGRLSSSEPNLQNISVRDEEGKLIRKAFYYPDENIEILSLDYSQVELRILASLSKCQPLIDVFNNGEDIHNETAKKVFHIDEITPIQRRKAKAVNFGIVYGISDWGLSEQLGISVKEAKEIIESFYAAFPEVGIFLKGIIDNAIKNGYVTTMNGRRRYLREIHDSNYQVREFAKRAAMNAPIQGTAADLIKIAMINVTKELKEKKLKTKLVLQIHDELLFKVPLEEKEIVYPLIKKIMENAMKLDVKLSVDGGYGRTWYDAK